MDAANIGTIPALQTHPQVREISCPRCGECLHYTQKTVSIVCSKCGRAFTIRYRMKEPGLQKVLAGK